MYNTKTTIQILSLLPMKHEEHYYFSENRSCNVHFSHKTLVKKYYPNKGDRLEGVIFKLNYIVL